MTVAATAIRKAGPTPGNSAATQFPFAFKVFKATDLQVILTTIATGAQSTLVLNDPNGYTVALNADQNANPGGSITYNPGGVPMPATQQLTILSVVPQEQGTHIANGGAFFANNIEDAVDKAVVNVQDLSAKVSASIQFPASDSAALNAVLPPAAQRANGALLFDSQGNVIVGGTVGNVPVSAAMTPVVEAATTDAGLTQLGFSTFFKTLIAAATKAALTALFTPLTTKGDLWGFGAADARVPVGGDGALLVADSTQATGLQWVRLGAGDKRQCVLSAALDGNGHNAAITTGAGLRPGLDAAPSPFVVTFASGYGVGGALDLVSTLSADVADILGADLAANNTSFIYADWASLTSVTWSKGLVPPQIGETFDRTQGALLNFEAADASVAMIDDFGNTWTAAGNAQIDTAQFKFGASSLLLDGTTDFIETSSITTLGSDSWEISLWGRWATLPTAGQDQVIFNAGNASRFGVLLRLDNTAGTIKLQLYLSSSGTSDDIAAPTLGANTVWATNTWYRIRLVFDALAGTYRVYLSIAGAAETQDISVSSTSRICALTKIRIGESIDAAAQQFNGWIDAFRFLRCATITTTETPSVSAPAITDHKIHFFSIPQHKMYEVTGASVAANTDPVMTQRNRYDVAECDTSGVAITAVRNRPIRGKYVSPWTAIPAVNVSTAFNHNLGTVEARSRVQAKCTTAISNVVPGDISECVGLSQSGTTTEFAYLPSGITRNVGYITTGNINQFLVSAMRSGGTTGISGTTHQMRLVVERTF